MEIRCLRRAADLVRDLPLSAGAALSFLRARSIVAGLILISFSLMLKAGYRAISPSAGA
jgi:hypothetical protein